MSFRELTTALLTLMALCVVVPFVLTAAAIYMLFDMFRPAKARRAMDEMYEDQWD